MRMEYLELTWECDRLEAVHGGVGERLKPPDCKSGARKGFVGSNPTRSTVNEIAVQLSAGPHSSAGRARPW